MLSLRRQCSALPVRMRSDALSPQNLAATLAARACYRILEVHLSSHTLAADGLPRTNLYSSTGKACAASVAGTRKKNPSAATALAQG